jgi:hypothetical protein
MSSGVAPGVGLGLHLHAQDAALAHEVVDVGHAQRGLQRLVEIGEIDAQRARLEPVDIEQAAAPAPALRAARQPAPGFCRPGPAPCCAPRSASRGRGRPVLQAEIEAADAASSGMGGTLMAKIIACLMRKKAMLARRITASCASASLPLRSSQSLRRTKVMCGVLAAAEEGEADHADHVRTSFCLR